MTRPDTTQIIFRDALPDKLKHSDNPPDKLYMRVQGSESFESLMSRPRVAIVGSRRVSAYGIAATRRFARELASRGVVIVSGMALGVDAIAHRAALEAGGLTIAVLPSPVEDPYPACHWQMAKDILEHDGALISEYPAETPSLPFHFVARNRIVTGLSDVLLITEATDKSGTMHTSRFALGQGVDVFAIPGDINRDTSIGTNNLIKTSAMAATEVSDITYAIGRLRDIVVPTANKGSAMRIRGANTWEQRIITLIERGLVDGNQILEASGMDVPQFNQHMTMLEITSKIRPLGNNQWSLG